MNDNVIKLSGETTGAQVWQQSTIDQKKVYELMHTKVLTRCPKIGRWNHGVVVGVRRDSLEISHVGTGIRRWFNTCNVYAPVKL